MIFHVHVHGHTDIHACTCVYMCMLHEIWVDDTMYIYVQDSLAWYYPPPLQVSPPLPTLHLAVIETHIIVM